MDSPKQCQQPASINHLFYCLLLYCFIVLLFYCFVVLLFCCFVVLLFCCFVVLLFCCQSERLIYYLSNIDEQQDRLNNP